MGKTYDVIIIGAGVSGTAQAYAIANFTNINTFAVIEAEKEAGCINSNATQNSQTLHIGDIETNFTAEKAKLVRHKSYFTKTYVETKNDPNLYLKGPKMVLGVGEKEVNFLEERYESIKDIYPEITKIYYDEIKKIEPNITKGRKDKNIVAIYNKAGLTINYSLLAKHLLKDAGKIAKERNKIFDVCINTKVKKIERIDNGLFKLTTKDNKVFKTKFLSICAGAHSMYFAKQLELESAKHLSLLCVAGNFYHTDKLLNTKTYTVQDPRLPFSAVHGDPDILNPDKTRYGPTTRIIFQLQRRKLKTFTDFIYVFRPVFGSFKAITKILTKSYFFWYSIKHNILFVLPIIGKYLFVLEVRKIIPTLSYSQIVRLKEHGGIRPQIVDTKSKNPLNLGEAKLEGENVLVNVTPSPGATTCVYNGIHDVKRITELTEWSFDQEKENSLFKI